MPSSWEWDEKPLMTAVDIRMRDNMNKAVLIVENDARKFAPVDTGRLRNSITHEITRSKDEIVGIETSVEQEYTSNQAII